MSSNPLPPNHFPPVRRVVTGHNAEGRSVFLEDKEAPTRLFDQSDPRTATFIDLYRTNESPAVNDGDFITDQDESLVGEQGSTFRGIDIGPHTITALHRTISVDYALVTRGTVICLLEDGQRKTLSEGDVLIQRGTIHSWINDTDEWARVFFTMLAAKPIEIGGKTLGAEFRPVPADITY